MTSTSFEDRAALAKLVPLVRDLNRPRALIYWTDLLASVLVVGAGLFLSRPFPEAILAGSPTAIAGLLIAAFALYRASYFNHELAHQSHRLPGFAIAWNVLVGIPLLIPSFLYSHHRHHHSAQGFATETDIEYLAPALRGPRGVLVLLVACFGLPIAYAGRFLLLVPLATFSPRLRAWIDVRVSGLGLLGLSGRAPPEPEEIRSWRLQELACCGYLVVMLALLATAILPFTSVLQFYCVTVVLLVLHAIRIMAGHRYELESGPRNRIEQVIDSYNFTRNRPVTWLMAPLGFHLHALHHLFPSIPYHNMPEAHRRINAALPANSFYHATESPSYFREVWRFITRRPDAPPSQAAPAREGGEPALASVTPRD